MKLKQHYRHIEALLRWYFNEAEADIRTARLDVDARQRRIDEITALLDGGDLLPSVGVAIYDVRETQQSSTADERMMHLLAESETNARALRVERAHLLATREVEAGELAEYELIERHVTAALQWASEETRQALIALHTREKRTGRTATQVDVAARQCCDESTLRERLTGVYAKFDSAFSSWLTRRRLPYFAQRHPAAIPENLTVTRYEREEILVYEACKLSPNHP